MKTKNTSIAGIILRLFIVMQVIAIVLITFYSCGRNKNWEAKLTKITLPQLPPPPPKPPTMQGSDTIWKIIDEPPIFPGGEELLVKHISKHTKYPDAAKANGIQGQVVVKFCISSKGNISGYEIVKSVNPDLDAEALRVIKTLTRFEPARKDGKPVPFWYYLPITFTLK